MIALDDRVYDAEIPVSCRFLTNPYTYGSTRFTKAAFTEMMTLDHRYQAAPYSALLRTLPSVVSHCAVFDERVILLGNLQAVSGTMMKDAAS